jgi:hypothetical protein
VIAFSNAENPLKSLWGLNLSDLRIISDNAPFLVIDHSGKVMGNYQNVGDT